MSHLDEYLPDPPSGLGYPDFRAARARFFAGLGEQAEIARLERALLMPEADPPPASGASGGPPSRRRRPCAGGGERSSGEGGG